MANRQSVIRESSRLGDWILREMGRELRVARLTAGMRLIDVARALRTSISHVSRVENGLIKGISVPALTRHAAVVGLKPYFKLYPQSADRSTLHSWRCSPGSGSASIRAGT